MALTVWCPGDGVDLRGVALECADCLHGKTEVKYHHVITVLLNGCQLVNIPLIPRNPEKRLLIRTLIDDRTVLQITQIKMPHRSILSRRCKQVLIPETNIKDGRIMCYQLGLYATCLDIPDCTGCINGTGTNHRWHVGIPIEACDWRAVIRICLTENTVKYM